MGLLVVLGGGRGGFGGDLFWSWFPFLARRGFFCCAGSLFVAAAVPEGTVSTPAKTKSTADETKLAAAGTK